MEILLLLGLAAALILFLLWRREKSALAVAKQQATNQLSQATADFTKEQERLQAEIIKLRLEIESLEKFRDVRDAVALAEQVRKSSEALKASAEKAAADAQIKAMQEVNRIHSEATRVAENFKAAAKQEADEIRQKANEDSRSRKEKTEAILASANAQANSIITAANKRAEEIAGDAYKALQQADELQQIATAMENVINGYGDRYLKPTFSLLDELAEAYGFDEAGQQLKHARERSRLMIEHERAATCSYVERNRRETAIRFVVDAFNGKVDSILTRSKAENFGTLEQQIRDAFSLVNRNGAAFREARITGEYLQARLDELHWLTAVNALREREKEEQKRIRDQIREEEKARREIERALKDAAKEEESLRKAMEKVQGQVAKATEEQRAAFEAKLAELQAKLVDAEARNQRALSMAQQTKAGHVYIISNIGSFGEEVYKVGMTRRLEPLDRIRELGDASVPFAFDIHAMLWSEDAPKLERDLHKQFVQEQVNKVNPRKEFFRVPLAKLREKVESLGLEASWTMSAAAAEYRESLTIEQRLKDNPVAAEDWLRHQLDVELAEESEPLQEEA